MGRLFLRVTKLIAPPPAVPAGASSNVPLGQASTSVTITGISASGSGFFDPGSGFANRIHASVSGGASGSVTVNSVTYFDPTHVSLNLNTTNASNTAYDVTITNPDGQFRTGNGILAAGGAVPSPSPSPTPTPTPTPLPLPTATPNSGTPYGVIIDPVVGSTFASSSVPFTWSAGSATAYQLLVGNSVGASDIFSSGQTGGHSITVNNLPTDGRTIYVRLWSLVNGAWYNPPGDYTYTAQPLIVLTPIISPASGTFRKKVTVAIGDATPGATIRYTIGTNISPPPDPTLSSTQYTGSFAISGKGTKILKAKAFKSGVPDSAITTATYTIR
jgi:Chitobiase/beta-hexosaminidase C-terminal domain